MQRATAGSGHNSLVVDVDVRHPVQALRRSTLLAGLARAGIIARTIFYALLVYLTARVALLPSVPGRPSGSRQDNAHGALATVSATPGGVALVLIAALGFAAFALTRFAAAAGDHSVGVPRRLTTVGSGLFYVGMAAVTASYALGKHSTGTEQQQQATVARLLGLPAGRVIVFGIGLIVIGVCLWQIRIAAGDDYDDGWDERRLPRWLRRAVPAVAVGGLVARALVFVPIGAFFCLAAVRYSAHADKGLDAVLASLAGNPYGELALWLVAAGFALFAVYSAIEAWARDMSSGA